MTKNACTVTRSKLYPTPGRSYRFAWKWIYTVTIPGEPYTFDGDTLGWVKSLCKRKAPGMPIVYAWKAGEEPKPTRQTPKTSASTKKKTPAQLDVEIAQALGRRGNPLRNQRRVFYDHHSTQLANWWRKATPEEDRVCYDTKTKALKAFLDTNYEVVQNYGGVDYAVSPSEFDAVNHKYNLHGKRAARTIAQAVWAAMPEGKPYCLDRIDLDALNDTSPARESHLAFRLPDYVYEAGLVAEEERYYRSLGVHARICRRCGRPLR